MKYQFQIVGAQQYEYIMGEHDFSSPEAAVEAYKALREAYSPKGGPGISTKEWNAAIDRYLTDGTGETEQFFRMSKSQQDCLQEIKKSYNRIEARNGKATDYGEGFSGDGQS